ncbi:9-O-acetylesterase [Flavobacterium noncentrifugens]|uniref:Sialate O-acetylesterase n=1 Tax=Flavobacterium noncentrifugens TaxID=1128970 RepID=A0A1G8WG50_9FLAO|nr:sialate O-acetylesterase [Flavobacterium noncentrifugens]GEP50914.1 9-O-acetylesterase [Flavobacterium noncentrifugens]SDJ77156.1 sialate O-acetylesterase [Flavobacterium noncentrifugens]
MKNKLGFLFAFLLSIKGFANITLPSVLSDHMVLQRNTGVKLWGWANPNEEIKITIGWNQKEYVIKTNSQAIWEVVVETPDAGGPFAISFKGYNEVILKDILIGEVWLCSGQSNMEMTPNWGIKNGEKEAKRANHPNIRFFTVPKLTATTPQNDLKGNWEACTPESMKNFSAVGYFFALQLQEKLNGIPVGLLSSSWGGSPAEIWMPEALVQNDPILLAAATKQKEDIWGPKQPGRAFNAMIYPLVQFRIAGTIWYQGESNVGSTVYELTFSSLINSWRALWNDDFPFYFVQIAPFNDGYQHDGGAVIRNAQRKVSMDVKNTAMVVTGDISTTDDIHPKDKKSVGVRLANLALDKTYGIKTGEAFGPVYEKISIKKDNIIIHFAYADGLHFKNKTSNFFEIAGADNGYFPAKAEIKNNTIIVKSDKVKKPVKVRYAWKNDAQPDLFNAAQLPASTFVSE